MTGSKPQLYNGVMLLFTFFSCRLVWGTYQSIRVYQDVWTAIHHRPNLSNMSILKNGTTSVLHTQGDDGIMRFAGGEFVPIWLASTYLGSNVVLNALNYYWFGKMIETVRKRFQPPKEHKRKEKAIVTTSTGVDGSIKIELDETEIRRRNMVDDEIEIAAVS